LPGHFMRSRTRSPPSQVGVGLLLRLARPGLLNPGQANLCGPAAFLFNLLSDQPGEYARYAIDMYEKGAARIDHLLVKLSSDLRSFRLLPGTTDPIDWITMASLRNSEDWFLHFDSIHGTLSGATTQLEMAWWFDRAGYSDIGQEANFSRHQRDADDEASQLWAAGYRVCLLIDDQMLSASEQAQSGSALFMDRHWIVLRSKIDRSGGNLKMKIFTWGKGTIRCRRGTRSRWTVSLRTITVTWPASRSSANEARHQRDLGPECIGSPSVAGSTRRFSSWPTVAHRRRLGFF
jgi:hypothetical protein